MVSLIRQLFGGLITFIYPFIRRFLIPFKKVFPKNNLFILDTDIGFDPDDTLALAYLLKFLSRHYTRYSGFKNVILISSAEPPGTNQLGLPAYSRAVLLVQTVMAISKDIFNDENRIFELGLTIYQGPPTQILDSEHFVSCGWEQGQYQRDGQVVVESLKEFYQRDSLFYTPYIKNLSSDFRFSNENRLSSLLEIIRTTNGCTYCSIGPKTNLAYLLSQTDKIKQIVSMSMALPRPNKSVNTNVRLDPQAEEYVMNWVKEHPQCLYVVIPSYLLDHKCEWYHRDAVDKNKIMYVPEIESFLKKTSWWVRWNSGYQSRIWGFIQKHLMVDWDDPNCHQRFWTYGSSKVSDPITVMVSLSLFIGDVTLCPVVLRKVVSSSYNSDKRNPTKYMILGEIIFDQQEENVSKTIKNRTLNETTSEMIQGIQFTDLDYGKNSQFYMADELIVADKLNQGNKLNRKLKWLSLFEDCTCENNNLSLLAYIIVPFITLAVIYHSPFHM